VRHLPHIISLNHKSQQLRVGATKGSSHFSSKSFLAVEEALDSEFERICFRTEQVGLKNRRSGELAVVLSSDYETYSII